MYQIMYASNCLAPLSESAKLMFVTALEMDNFWLCLLNGVTHITRSLSKILHCLKHGLGLWVIDHFRLLELYSNNFTIFVSTNGWMWHRYHTYFLCESLPVHLSALWHLAIIFFVVKEDLVYMYPSPGCSLLSAVCCLQPQPLTPTGCLLNLHVLNVS